MFYSQLSLRRTPLGPASVCLRKMSVLERCPSYRESNKESKERQGPTLSVRFTEKPKAMVNFKCKIGTDIYIVSEHMAIATVSCSHRLKWL